MLWALLRYCIFFQRRFCTLFAIFSRWIWGRSFYCVRTYRVLSCDCLVLRLSCFVLSYLVLSCLCRLLVICVVSLCLLFVFIRPRALSGVTEIMPAALEALAKFVMGKQEAWKMMMVEKNVRST